MDPEDEVKAHEQARIDDQVGTPADPKDVSDKGGGIGEDDNGSGAEPHQGPKEEVQRAHAPLVIGVNHLRQGGQDKGEQNELDGFHSVNLCTLARMSRISVCSPTLKLWPFDRE